MLQEKWDYLIVTASNENQAKAYETQLGIRKELKLLTEFQHVLVIPDLDGKRIGSGGSTLLCLIEILNRELSSRKGNKNDPDRWVEILGKRRILILHAGGDSKRLPAYAPCGKLFVPVPGETDTAIGTTLFDRQLPIYMALPAAPEGQIVITSGDVLVRFDPSSVHFSPQGFTGLGSLSSPQQASHHGVFCLGPDQGVNLFLQKPSIPEQQEKGAINRYGQSILDIGVMNFDPLTAVMLLSLCGVKSSKAGKLSWSGAVGEAIVESGMDFYREICCALGTRSSLSHFMASAGSSGSKWKKPLFELFFNRLSRVRFSAGVLPRCEFLDFGTTSQIIKSGNQILREDFGVSQLETCIGINNHLVDKGNITGHPAWVEGCRIDGTLTLGGDNVVTGLELAGDLALPSGACLDLLPGFDRKGKKVWFVRCYGIKDTFKDGVAQGASFCGVEAAKWLDMVGATDSDVWKNPAMVKDRTVWDARLFPAVKSSADFQKWLWMFNPSKAGRKEYSEWKKADRYSLSEIAGLTDLETFHQRRSQILAQEIRRSLRRKFRLESGFSSRDLAFILQGVENRGEWVAEILAEACWYYGQGRTRETEAFVFSRIIHTLASALELVASKETLPIQKLLPDVTARLDTSTNEWLKSLRLDPRPGMTVGQWVRQAKTSAFENFERIIIRTGIEKPAYPKNALRSDEIVWGRAPARLDFGGGWTDTPPYSLEHGGCVVNTAIDLNQQPPIHVYARVIQEPVIRIHSIDTGARVEIRKLEELVNFRNAESMFGLAKAVLVLSGLSPDTANWPKGIDLAKMLDLFGGGVELTTLAAIPKGSGLGTSSIVGAVLLSVVQRVMGKTMTQKELFHGVLRLEQALTTGGGWQDQVGGAVGEVKVITANPGLVPDFKIHYVPADVLDPCINGGLTLLYYTGITRLAKNILQQVVGRYLDRDRLGMATLRNMQALVPQVAEAMSRKDLARFGKLIDTAWELNKQLDPDSTNRNIEELIGRIKSHIYGAKLLGAGGGGFLFMVCKSVEDASTIKKILQSEPQNNRARFFDFNVNRDGLVVTVC